MLHVYFSGERLGGLAQPRCQGSPRSPKRERLGVSPIRAYRACQSVAVAPSGMGRVGPHRKEGRLGSLCGQFSAIIAVNCPNNAMAMARLLTLPTPLDLPVHTGIQLRRLLPVLPGGVCGVFPALLYVVTWLQTMWSTAASSRSIGPILRRSSPEPEPASRR